jgi:hypothetical protein
MKQFMFVFFITIIFSSCTETNNKMTFLESEISFKSGKNTLKGILITPQNSNGIAITIIGPVAFVKEQAPILYAKSLAKKGFTTLVFDPTSHGDSEGKPRRFESGIQKVKDIQASIDFLQAQNSTFKIHGVAVCQGVNWMIKAANVDTRIESVSLIAGHYLVPKVAELYTGGKEKLAERLSIAKQAKEDFEQNNVVSYIPVVSGKEANALLRNEHIRDWYMPWATNEGGRKGKWENRITQMSEFEIWSTDISSEISKLNQTLLMIHSDKAASGSDVPRELFKQIKSDKKKLVWFEDQVQFDFYDNEKIIDRVVNQIVQWNTKY